MIIHVSSLLLLVLSAFLTYSAPLLRREACALLKSGCSRTSAGLSSLPSELRNFGSIRMNVSPKFPHKELFVMGRKKDNDDKMLRLTPVSEQRAPVEPTKLEGSLADYESCKDVPAIKGRYDFRYSSYLGEGGYGKVHSAVERTTGRRVAVKEMRYLSGPYMQNVAMRELDNMNLLAESGHPAFVQLYKFFELKDGVCLVLERIMGYDLGVVLDHTVGKLPGGRKENGGRLREDVTRDIAHQLLEILETLHEKVGLVHMDLKPLNMMLDNKGKLRILDVGISQKLDEDGLVPWLHPGTPVFVPPTMRPTIAPTTTPPPLAALGNPTLYSDVRSIGSSIPSSKEGSGKFTLRSINSWGSEAFMPGCTGACTIKESPRIKGVPMDLYAAGASIYSLLFSDVPNPDPASYDMAVHLAEYRISDEGADFLRKILSFSHYSSAREALQHPWFSMPIFRMRAQTLRNLHDPSKLVSAKGMGFAWISAMEEDRRVVMSELLPSNDE